MNKKGFTLIELLAVIVILAIIALIATPIVLNIISDAKSESGLRSADFYLDALELSIAQATLDGQNITDNTYNILDNGNLCLSYDASEKCIEELKVEVKGKTPESGTITILNGEIDGASLILDDREIMKNSKAELVYVKTLDEVCVYKEGIKGEISSKYECKVDPNKEPYTFYILSYNDKDGNIVTDKTNAESVNLIMDSNIKEDGEAIKTESSNTEKISSEWVNESDYVKAGGTVEEYYEYGDSTYKNAWNKGPITAMNYLQEATKNWTNINEMLVSTFTDYSDSFQYLATHNISTPHVSYARMPFVSEIRNAPSNGVWLIDYLSGEYDDECGVVGRHPISIFEGYWLLSTITNEYGDSKFGALTYICGDINYFDVNTRLGIRPVISLKIK